MLRVNLLNALGYVILELNTVCSSHWKLLDWSCFTTSKVSNSLVSKSRAYFVNFISFQSFCEIFEVACIVKFWCFVCSLWELMVFGQQRIHIMFEVFTVHGCLLMTIDVVTMQSIKNFVAYLLSFEDS